MTSITNSCQGIELKTVASRVVILVQDIPLQHCVQIYRVLFYFLYSSKENGDYNAVSTDVWTPG